MPEHLWRFGDKGSDESEVIDIGRELDKPIFLDQFKENKTVITFLYIENPYELLLFSSYAFTALKLAALSGNFRGASRKRF